MQKEQFINGKVQEIYPERAKIIENQINDLKVQLSAKDSQLTVLRIDVQKHPMTRTTSITTAPVPRKTIYDSITKTNHTIYTPMTTTSSTEIPNPNITMVHLLDTQVTMLRKATLAYGDTLANLRKSIQKRLEEKTGFLDELTIMFGLLSKNTPAMIVYLVWFFLLLGLECLILMNKRHERPTDYDAMINHQMNTHLKKLNLLSEGNNL